VGVHLQQNGREGTEKEKGEDRVEKYNWADTLPIAPIFSKFLNPPLKDRRGNIMGRGIPHFLASPAKTIKMGM